MKCFISYLALILIVIGALNWGLWGFFQFDFFAWLGGGNTTWGARLISAVVGLAGLWSLKFFGCCRCCCKGSCDCKCKCCSSSRGGKGSCSR